MPLLTSYSGRPSSVVVMPPAAWQLPWLRLHLVVRELLATPAHGEMATVKRELERCAELRRAMIQAGWFN